MPLPGGQNPELKEGTGFEGSAPKSQRMMTPSSLGTPGLGGATPGPGSTPMRGTREKSIFSPSALDP